MGLKIKKFVIQWRKFESKKSSRNEVMNFLRLLIFSEFFMIFLEFLELKKSQKGVNMCWTRTEMMWHDMDMWQHHGSRHKPMRAHVGAYVAQRNQAMYIGPTNVVGPSKRIGGRTRPSVENSISLPNTEPKPTPSVLKN